MAKKVTGRTDQGTKKFPGDEEYKKMLAEIDKKDKSQKPLKPKLNVSNINKSIFNEPLGKVGQGGTSKIGTLARIVRKNRININSLIKSKKNQNKKITIIKNIIKNQQSTIGQKIPGSNQDNLQKTLDETNKLLVDIQKQLVDSITKDTLDSEERERRESVEGSKEKLKKEESLLEKTSKAINKGVKKVANKMLSPIKNIFDKIIDFLLILGGGIAVNAIFEWLKDPKNMETVKGVFKFIQDNYLWILGAVAGIAALKIVGPIMTLLKPLGMLVGLLGKGVPILVGILGSPAFLAALGIGGGIAATLFGMKAAVDFFKRKAAGGEAFFDGFESLKSQLRDEEITVIGSGKDEKFYVGKYRGQGGGAQNKTLEESGSEEQKKLVVEYIKKRDQLIELRDNRDAAVESNLDAYVPVPFDKDGMGRSATKRAGTDPNIAAREKIRIETNTEFESKIPSIIQGRKMGGPVRAGKPYIVGDQLGMKTAEIFVPSSDGTVINNFDTNKIINNLKTQKIYQTISKKKKRRRDPSINMMELPAIVNKGKPPEISLPSGSATEVPQIASSDSSNSYLEKSLQIYGITV